MGFHTCEACKSQRRTYRFPNTSSGDVNLMFMNGHVWVMPDMILHYVADHGWQPPDDFVTDVMSSDLVSGSRRQTRGISDVFAGAVPVGYLESKFAIGHVPDGFVDRLESLMNQSSRSGMRIQTKGI